jgi:D-3-phosphoglycerate dehydrogenase
MDGYQMALKATPYVLITPHHDRPGMIAKVATVLGEAGVNISALQVARSGPEAGGESIMVFNLDNAPSEQLLGKIKELEGIYGSLYINL